MSPWKTTGLTKSKGLSGYKCDGKEEIVVQSETCEESKAKHTISSSNIKVGLGILEPGPQFKSSASAPARLSLLQACAG